MTTPAQLFSDNASALLAANVLITDTTVQVASGQGALYPSPGAGQYFIATIEDNAGNIEYVKCTSRSADVLTVVRAQEGTSAQAFTANLAVVEIRETAGTFQNFYQKSGDTLSGDMNGGGHNLTNVVMAGGTAKIEGIAEIVATPLRGATGVSSNEVDVPSDGTRATAGGLKILCAGDPIPAFTIGQIMLWYGALINVPALWHACDGTSPVNSLGNPIPVPDMRDKFAIGAGGAVSPTAGGTGGGGSATTSSDGITGVTDAHVLITAEMPAHSHRYWGPGAFSNVSNGSGHGWDWGVANGYQTTPPPGLPGGDPSAGGPFIENTGGGTGHTHALTAAGAHTHTYTAPNPAYVGLFYIMYIG